MRRPSVRALESPILSLKSYRGVPRSQWFRNNSVENERMRVLSIACPPNEPYIPQECDFDNYYSAVIEDSIISGVVLQDAEPPFHFIYLDGVLEHVEGRLSFVKRMMDLVVPGGALLSCSSACDDAKEAYNLLNPSPLQARDFLRWRLSNKQIVQLRPSSAAFLNEVVRFPQRKNLVTFLRSIGFPNTELEHLWGAGRSFSVTRLTVAMLWLKEDDNGYRKSS